MLASERQRSRATIAQRASSLLARGGVGAAAAAAVAGGTAAQVSLDVMPAEVAGIVAAIRLQGRWRHHIQGRLRVKLERAERVDLEEKLALAEAREVAVRQARELEQAQVAMFLEMEQTVTTLTTEHAVELAAAREAAKAAADEAALKEQQLQAIFEAASPRSGAPVPAAAASSCPRHTPGSALSACSAISKLSATLGTPPLEVEVREVQGTTAAAAPRSASGVGGGGARAEVDDDDLEPPTLDLSTLGSTSFLDENSVGHRPTLGPCPPPATHRP